MSGLLAQRWWVLVVRGLVAILFGLCALIWPGLTVGILVALFAIYALMNGVFTLIGGLRAESRMRRATLILEGAISIAAGILTWVWPGLTTLALLYFIVAWAILIGIMEIVAAVQLRNEIASAWHLGVAGALSLLFGLICLIHPASGALAIIWVVALYPIAFGITLIMLGFRLRGTGGRLGAALPRGA